MTSSFLDSWQAITSHRRTATWKHVRCLFCQLYNAKLNKNVLGNVVGRMPLMSVSVHSLTAGLFRGLDFQFLGTYQCRQCAKITFGWVSLDCVSKLLSILQCHNYQKRVHFNGYHSRHYSLEVQWKYVIELWFGYVWFYQSSNLSLPWQSCRIKDGWGLQLTTWNAQNFFRSLLFSMRWGCR